MESFINAYNWSNLQLSLLGVTNWTQTVDYWSAMTHQERLTALSRIGKGRVNSSLLAVLRRTDLYIEPYVQFFQNN